MSRGWGFRSRFAFVFCLTSTALLQAQQQQYGDPGTYGNTFLTQRTSPPVPYGLVPRIDVTYFVDNTFTAQEHAIINQAAAIWSGTTASVNLVEVNTLAASGIDFSTPNLNNNTFDLANRTILSQPGVGAFPPPNNLTPWRNITQASIEIDHNPPGNPAYYYGVGVIAVDQYDYLTLILREFGFGLGLGFSPDPTSVMDTDIQEAEIHNSLNPYDVNALQILYGTPEPATWALFGIGLLVVGLRRKFIF